MLDLTKFYADERLLQLAELSNIPGNCGEQFIWVKINIGNPNWGSIQYGFRWKCDMGEYDFSSIEDAIEKVKELRKRANLKEEE